MLRLLRQQKKLKFNDWIEISNIVLKNRKLVLSLVDHKTVGNFICFFFYASSLFPFYFCLPSLCFLQLSSSSSLLHFNSNLTLILLEMVTKWKQSLPNNSRMEKVVERFNQIASYLHVHSEIYLFCLKFIYFVWTFTECCELWEPNDGTMVLLLMLVSLFVRSFCIHNA